MSEFIRKYTESVQNEVEVIVEGATTEEEASTIAEEHVALGEGKYRVSGTTTVYVTINVTCEDSELDEGDVEDEWEPDEEEDEDEEV